MSTTVLAIIYTFHLLAAVVWIGGLIMLALVVLPGARRVLTDAPTMETLLHELERRFNSWANLSLVVLIATGMLQMSADENYGGLLQFDTAWAWAMLLKHLAIIGMAFIAGYVALALEPERRRLQTLATAGHRDDQARYELEQRRTRLAWLNLVCGVLTLAFTAVATAQ